MRKIFLFYLILFVITQSGCNSNENKKPIANEKEFSTGQTLEPPPPPPPPDTVSEKRCNELKKRTYEDLNNGIVYMITDAFPKGSEPQRSTFFDYFLEKKFKMEHFPLWEWECWSNSILPIMDSAIAVKYGPHGKDSIIRLINYMADSAYIVYLQKNAYSNLKRGIVQLITNDYPDISNSSEVNPITRRKWEIFEELLTKKFKMELLPLKYDSIFYTKYVIPIMDSAINVNYGVNGKARMIKLLYHMTDSIYNERFP